MSELEFLRMHDDGQHLVLAAPDGTRHILAVTPQLRSALRRDPHEARGEAAAAISPREIQTRLRAGESVEALAVESGLAVEALNRYAGPVIAEQEYVIGRVQASRQAFDIEAPTLGDLVAQRLETRDVDPEAVRWSAARHPGEPWVVAAEFEVGDKPRIARWNYDTSTRALHALDDEARWLSQPDATPFEPDGVRLTTVDTPTDTGESDILLDDLYLRRGVRTRKPDTRADIIAGGEDSPFDAFGPVNALEVDDLDDLGALRGRPVPDPSPAVHDAKIVELPRPAHHDTDDHPSGPDDNDRPGRPHKARAKVPSLNEIVFGAKPKP